MNQSEDLHEIEREEGNENVHTEIPFDPNDININIVPRNIGQLVELLEDDIIIIPPYQRLPNLWTDKMKSRFIESLILNLPIPLFYFDEGADKKWRVIDGLQRISTLDHFILAGKKDFNISSNTEPLVLVDLEFRKEFNGKTWAELPRDIQRRISSNQVTINLIGKGTPDQVKYNIFSRINQGGIELETQEIRTALFQGYRTEFLEELVSPTTTFGAAFKAATNNSIPTRRQQDLDFVTRFISFYLIDYLNYEPDMDTFLTLGTRAIPRDSAMQQEIKNNFEESMKLAFAVFGMDAFRKRLEEGEKRKPINKPIFEIISVYFAKCNPTQRQAILGNKDEFKENFRLLNHNKKFWSSITTGTAAKERVKQRHEDFKNLLSRY